jgi:RNA polymerase sigma-70 factor (ECF subfamily)
VAERGVHTAGRLTRAFTAGLPAPQQEQAALLQDLEQALLQLVARAEESSFGFELSPEVYVAYVAARIGSQGRLDQTLANLPADDLYLACGCARGDPEAIAAFDRRHLADIRAALRWLGIQASVVEEVEQVLRTKLFVAEEGQRPKIASYSGRSQLRRWLRVSAVRAALAYLEREKRAVPLPDDLPLKVADPNESPELQYLQQRYKRQFKACLEQALTVLSDREQNILRYRYVDDLTTDQIGSMYRVHRSTASRWLSTAREKILRNTRELLMQRLRVDRSQYESILRLVGDKLELTLERVLEGGGQEPESEEQEEPE